MKKKVQTQVLVRARVRSRMTSNHALIVSHLTVSSGLSGFRIINSASSEIRQDNIPIHTAVS